MKNYKPPQNPTRRGKSSTIRAKSVGEDIQKSTSSSGRQDNRQLRAKNRGADWLLIFSALHCVALLVLWGLENYVGERNRWTAFLLYLPQQGLVFMPVLLLLLTARRQIQNRCTRSRDEAPPQKARNRSRILWLLNIAVAALVWFGFLGFNLPLGARAVPTKALRLRVMTFNVHVGMSGATRIARAIRYENPDIICLQEAHVPQLKKLLPEWHFVRSGEVATLSRFPIAKSRVHPLKNLERVVLETQIAARGRRVSIYNTHFITDRAVPKNGARVLRSLGGSASLRLHQMRQLQSIVPQTSRVLVLGDFNNPPRGLLHRRLASRWTDAFAAMGTGFGYTYRSDLPLMRIDYIWTSRDVRVLGAHVPRGRASDHRAVVAEIAVQ